MKIHAASLQVDSCDKWQRALNMRRYECVYCHGRSKANHKIDSDFNIKIHFEKEAAK